MLQSLLAERFQIVVHSEQRERQIYALVLARPDGKLGPRLRAVMDCTPEGKGRETTSLPQAGQCGGRGGVDGHLEFGGLPLSMGLVRNSALLREVRRVIVDRTGLSGAFEGSLDWTPTEAATSQAVGLFSAPPPDGASVFTALQEQFGLKLESSRGPVEVLVIDHAEPPQPD
jgi:uncharacterized protein (TIGR03435 family)